jgi:two-component system, NtrC family, response regulator HydG
VTSPPWSSGAFRQDLFYRLNVVRRHVPPLRERPEDIRTLAEHFIACFSRQFEVGTLRPSPELLDALAARSWPGNVRELENTIERMVALSDGEELDLGLIGGDAAPGAAPAAGLRAQVEAFERRLLVEAMAEARGNQAEAARLLRIGRATMHDKLRKHGLSG